MSLNIESQGHEGGLLAGLRSSGPSQEETITRAGATITLFTFGDHLHVLHWIEGAEAEASMVVDGPNRDEALNLFDRLEPLTAEGWTELVLSRPYTTTTSAP